MCVCEREQERKKGRKKWELSIINIVSYWARNSLFVIDWLIHWWIPVRVQVPVKMNEQRRLTRYDMRKCDVVTWCHVNRICTQNLSYVHTFITRISRFTYVFQSSFFFSFFSLSFCFLVLLACNLYDMQASIHAFTIVSYSFRVTIILDGYEIELANGTLKSRRGRERYLGYFYCYVWSFLLIRPQERSRQTGI